MGLRDGKPISREARFVGRRLERGNYYDHIQANSGTKNLRHESAARYPMSSSISAAFENPGHERLTRGKKSIVFMRLWNQKNIRHESAAGYPFSINTLASYKNLPSELHKILPAIFAFRQRPSCWATPTAYFQA